MTNDEKKLEAMEDVLFKHFLPSNDFKSIAKEILEALKQFDPEPVEFEVIESTNPFNLGSGVEYSLEFKKIPWFKTEEAMKAYCEFHGLKIVGGKEWIGGLLTGSLSRNGDGWEL